MDDSKKYLSELARYVDSQSILFISQEGELKRIYCPFHVIALVKVYRFEKGQVLIVEAVKVTVKFLDVYIIDGRAYLIQYFDIIPGK